MTGTATTEPIRVAIADDQTLLRQTLRALINAQDDMDAPWEAANGSDAVALVRVHHPDVLLLDIRMPGMNGLDTLHQIRAQLPHSPTKIIMLTMYELDEYVRQALATGADGFLLKDAEPDHILRAIRRVRTDEPQLSPSITQTLITQFINADTPPAPPPPPGLDDLTPREREVLTLIGQGYSNDEIMAKLVISKGTIKSHIAALRRKTRAKDRVQLALLGTRLN